MTLHELIAEARQRFLQAGIVPGEAALDAELLAREALGWDRATLLTAWQGPAPATFRARYGEWVARRAGREPVAHIIGHREFWKLDFRVSPDVLIPRPETEYVVEEALACVKARGGSGATAARGSPARLLVADVGTGSGCLAISLATELPGALIIATDTSGRALAVARDNVTRLDAGTSVRLVRTDLLRGTRCRFHLIVSNPPYVSSRDIPSLPPEVRDHEPLQALIGGDDGLQVIRRFLAESVEALAPGGWLIVEFGFGQEQQVRREVAQHAALSLVRIRADLQGIPRTAVVRRQQP